MFHSVKKEATINIVMFIRVDRRVLYLSPSFPGNKNDLQIVEATYKLWNPFFDMSENGLGDLGFSGLRDSKKGIRPDVPPQGNMFFFFHFVMATNRRKSQKMGTYGEN